MVTLPNLLTNGTTANGSQVYANDAALRDALGAIKNANIASGAAIDKDKLAQKFTLSEENIILVPAQSGTVLGVSGTTAVYTINQATVTTILKKRLTLRSGQAASLVLVEFYVARMQNTGANPLLSLLVDGVQVGGQSVPIDTSDAYYTVANSNPVDNVLIPVSDLSVLEFQVGASAAPSGTVTLAGVTCRLVIKKELVP